MTRMRSDVFCDLSDGDIVHPNVRIHGHSHARNHDLGLGHDHVHDGGDADGHNDNDNDNHLQNEAVVLQMTFLSHQEIVLDHSIRLSHPGYLVQTKGWASHLVSLASQLPILPDAPLLMSPKTYQGGSLHDLQQACSQS